MIYRELPTPLLTHEYQETFIAVSGIHISHRFLSRLSISYSIEYQAKDDTVLSHLIFCLQFIFLPPETSMITPYLRQVYAMFTTR